MPSLAGFQGISPRQVEFAAFGGYKGAGIPAISKGLDSMYTGAMDTISRGTNNLTT